MADPGEAHVADAIPGVRDVDTSGQQRRGSGLAATRRANGAAAGMATAVGTIGSSERGGDGGRAADRRAGARGGAGDGSEQRPGPSRPGSSTDGLGQGTAAERRRLREDFRRRGLAVPRELLEPEAWAGGGRAAQRGSDASQRVPGQKVLVRTWRCDCGFHNWPSRSSCRICDCLRRPGAPRKDDWWDPVALPHGAEVDAGVDHGPPRAATSVARGSASGRPAGGGSDAPGCPTTRRGPVRAAAAGGGPPPPPPPPPPRRADAAHHGPDPRRDAPGVLDERDGDELGWDEVGPLGRRARRARKNRPKVDGGGATSAAAAMVGDGEPELGASADAVEFAGAPKPHELPALRNWTIPTVPRSALLRDYEAASAQLEQLEAAGAKASRIRRAERRKATAEQQVRVGGGHTSRSLLWQMQTEEKNIDKAIKSIEAEKKKNDDRREAVSKLEAEIAAGSELVQRLEDRKDQAISRLRYLSQQKWVEWIPDHWVLHFKELASTLGATQHQAYSMVQTLVDLMVPPAEAMDLTAEDSSTDGEASSLGSGPTAPEEADRLPADGASQQLLPSPSDLLAGRIGEAEARLEDLRRQRLAAMAQAQAGQLDTRRRTKRALGGDVGKPQDGDGDEEMVPMLLPEQAEGLLRKQIDEVVEELRRLREEAGSEAVPCLSAPLRGVGSAPPPRASDDAASSNDVRGRPPLPRRGLLGHELRGRRGGSTGLSAGAARGIAARWETDEERREKSRRDPPAQGRRASLGPPARAAGGEAGRAPSVPPPSTLHRLDAMVVEEFDILREATETLVSAVETGRQSRMQETQDREARISAAVLQAKAEIEAKRAGQLTPVPHELPPTYGPTGQRLDEQQRTMLHAAALHDDGVEVGDGHAAVRADRRTARWDRLDGDGSPPPPPPWKDRAGGGRGRGWRQPWQLAVAQA